MNSPDCPFYLAIKHNRKHKNTEWYKRQPIGENTLQAIMKIWISKQICLAVKQIIVPENLHVQNYYMLDFTQQQFNNWQGTEMFKV